MPPPSWTGPGGTMTTPRQPPMQSPMQFSKSPMQKMGGIGFSPSTFLASPLITQPPSQPLHPGGGGGSSIAAAGAGAAGRAGLGSATSAAATHQQHSSARLSVVGAPSSLSSSSSSSAADQSVCASGEQSSNHTAVCLPRYEV